METINPNITTLKDLLDYDAQYFVSAEIQLSKILPDWVGKSGSLKLKTVLSRYLDYIQGHIKNMENFIVDEKITSLSLSNPIMKAFIDETIEKLKYCRDNEIQDACLLASVQAINHFKISTYGTAAAFAKTLGMSNYAEIFHEAEINEKQIDDRLNQLAEFEINIKAKAPIAIEA
jgi:ferritin-like metal-binding protein YciE